MVNTKQIKVHTSLIDVFGNIGKDFASGVKKEFDLDELFVSNVLASQLVAGKCRGEKNFKFKVRKTGYRKGILELT